MQVKIAEEPCHEQQRNPAVAERQHLQTLAGGIMRHTKKFPHMQPNRTANVVQRRVVVLPHLPHIEIRQVSVLIEIENVTGVSFVSHKVAHIMLPLSDAGAEHIAKPHPAPSSKSHIVSPLPAEKRFPASSARPPAPSSPKPPSVSTVVAEKRSVSSSPAIPTGSAMPYPSKFALTERPRHPAISAASPAYVRASSSPTAQGGVCVPSPKVIGVRQTHSTQQQTIPRQSHPDLQKRRSPTPVSAVVKPRLSCCRSDTSVRRSSTETPRLWILPY